MGWKARLEREREREKGELQQRLKAGSARTNLRNRPVSKGRDEEVRRDTVT